MEPKHVGLLGAALVVVGVFCPCLSLPIAGNINLFANGRGDGIIMIVLAALAGYAVWDKRTTFAKILSVIAIAVLAYDAIMVMNRVNEIKTGMDSDLAGNPFAGLAMAVASSVTMEWGWVVMALGLIMIFFSAVTMAKREQERLARLMARD